MCPKHSHDASECADCRTVPRFTPALIEIGDSKAAHQARCDVLNGPETYEMPADGWVCFHCGERFTSPNKARDHFREGPRARAVCIMTAVELQEGLREYSALKARFGPR